MEQQKRETGSVELRTSQRDRKPALSEEDKARISQCLDEKADMTIEEIREKLHLSASYATVERAVVGMGYTRKKKSLYAAERNCSRCAPKAGRVEADHEPGNRR
ncbi:MAG: transcriptional regulator [Oscillospiraceae bacterium]|nr:transcriptional regulator [Oscillospiraceae bacterium]